jgi:hypothetical protein
VAIDDRADAEQSHDADEAGERPDEERVGRTAGRGVEALALRAGLPLFGGLADLDVQLVQLLEVDLVTGHGPAR